MMLVPTMKVVALSVAVGWRVRTGVGVLVTDGMLGMLSVLMLAVAEMVVDGAIERDSGGVRVADADGATDAEAEIVALLRISPEEMVEVGNSEAGIEEGMLRESVAETVGL